MNPPSLTSHIDRTGTTDIAPPATPAVRASISLKGHPVSLVFHSGEHRRTQARSTYFEARGFAVDHPYGAE